MMHARRASVGERSMHLSSLGGRGGSPGVLTALGAPPHPLQISSFRPWRPRDRSILLANGLKQHCLVCVLIASPDSMLDLLCQVSRPRRPRDRSILSANGLKQHFLVCVFMASPTVCGAAGGAKVAQPPPQLLLKVILVLLFRILSEIGVPKT